MEIADSAMGWGNASFCHTVLAGRLALLHFPDGCRLIASLLYPVRSSIVTSEAARAAANLAFYASSNGLHLIVPISTGGCMSSMVLGMQTAALTSRGMSPTAGTSTDDTLLCSGVLPEIVKAIQWSAAEADDDVAQCCCMALSDICLDSPSRRIAAVESDAVVAVMAVLEKFNSEPGDVNADGGSLILLAGHMIEIHGMI